MIEHEKAVMPNDVAAISVGLIGNDVYLDLDYVLDSNADVDMNVIMTSNGEFVEIQGTGEESTFTGDQLNRLIELSKTGISKLHKFQSELFEKFSKINEFEGGTGRLEPATSASSVRRSPRLSYCPRTTSRIEHCFQYLR